MCDTVDISLTMAHSSVAMIRHTVDKGQGSIVWNLKTGLTVNKEIVSQHDGQNLAHIDCSCVCKTQKNRPKFHLLLV